MKLRKIISFLIIMTMLGSVFGAASVSAEESSVLPYSMSFDDMTDEDLNSADEWEIKTSLSIVDATEISSDANVNEVMKGKVLKLSAGDKKARLNFRTLGIQSGEKYVVEFDMLQETLSTTRDSNRIMMSGGNYPEGYTSMIWTMLNNWQVIRNAKGTGGMHKSKHYTIVMDIATVEGAKFEYSVKDNSNSWALTYSDTVNMTDFYTDFGFTFVSYDYDLYIDNLEVYKQCEVKVSANDERGGIVNGGGMFKVGEEITLSAIANEGYDFLGWFEGDELVSSEDIYTFVTERSIELVARFKNPNPKYTVSALSENEEAGTVTGGGTYAENADITLAATPKAGYKFVGWFEGEECVSNDAVWSFASVEAVDRKIYTAKFDNSEYISATSQLKEKLDTEDKAGFVEIFDQTLVDMLNFGTGFEEDVNFSDVAEILYRELTKDGAKELGTDAEYEQMLYRAFVAADLLNNNKEIDVFALLDGVIGADEELKGFYELHIKSGAAEAFLAEVMTKKNTAETIEDMASLTDVLKKGIVLAGVEYPNGYGSIEDLFKAYKELLGLNKITKYSSVWKNLANDKATYKTTDDLLERYDELVDKAETPKNSGGSGGGGSSTGSGGRPIVSGKTPVSSVEVGIQKEEEKPKTIELKFKDLNSVPWAYEAIARMFDKGVINGYSETEFRPESTVTREQYVKMLVCAMNIPIDDSDLTFADVEDGAWYKPYIATAVKCGFVNGMDAERFGTGMEITRQDMAVMAYKAAVYKGLISQNAELAFTDAENIADYAKTAVAELSAIKVINGVGDGSFNPLAVATRAEAAVIMDNIVAFLK